MLVLAVLAISLVAALIAAILAILAVLARTVLGIVLRTVLRAILAGTILRIVLGAVLAGTVLRIVLGAILAGTILRIVLSAVLSAVLGIVLAVVVIAAHVCSPPLRSYYWFEERGLCDIPLKIVHFLNLEKYIGRMAGLRRKTSMWLPISGSSKQSTSETQKTGLYAACPCCGNRTIPHEGDALAFICPVCFWEIDLFLNGEEEKSDQNHGLTLRQARINFRKFGAVMPSLKQYCRLPTEDEYPLKNDEERKNRI